MKKKNLLLALIPFVMGLPSCSPSGESKPQNFEELLSTLKNGYEVEALVTEVDTVVGGSSAPSTFLSYQNISSSKGKYREISYEETLSPENPSKDVLSSDLAYQEEGGNVVLKALSFSNEVVSSPVMDSDNQPLNWSLSYLENAFSLLSAQDFAKNEKEETYTLKDDVSMNVKTAFGVQLHGLSSSEGVTLKSLSITLKEGKFLFEAALNPYTTHYLADIQIEKSYVGEFLSYGKEVSLPKPIEGTEDSIFKEAMSKFANGNYETKVINYEIPYKDGRYKLVNTAEGKATSSTFEYCFKDGNDKVSENAFYYQKDNVLQRGAIYDKGLFASGLPFEGSVSDFSPSFNYSSLFFSKNGSTYSLKKEYLNLFSSTAVFTPFVDDYIESLSIEIGTDEIKITSENSGNGSSIFGAKEEINYFNPGKVTPFDYSSMTSDSSTLTLEDLIRSEDDYIELANYISDNEAMKKIPTFGGIYSEGYLDNLGDLYALETSVESFDIASSLEASYGDKLVTLGYSKNATDEGDEYTLDLSSNRTLTIAPMAYSSSDLVSGTTTEDAFFLVLISVSSNN